MTLKMDREQLQSFLRDQFPQAKDDFEVLQVTPDCLTLGMAVGHNNLRPGDTVSGPTTFALADVAMYLAILSHIGPKALTVTTSCAIDFMRKPVAGVPLIAKAQVLKLGRVLAVGHVLVYSQGDDAPVASANLTYSIPPASD